MKSLTALILMVIFLPALSLFARDGGGRGAEGGGRGDFSGSSGFHQGGQAVHTESADQPVVINMHNGSSGGHNRNYPSQHTQTAPSHNQAASSAPSYGALKMNRTGAVHTHVSQAPHGVSVMSAGKPNASVGALSTSANMAGVVHHHPYEPNYVRKRLQALGVKSAPGYITHMDEVIHTDRLHSMIDYPHTGFNNQSIHATMFSARHFNDQAVKSHMSMLGNTGWRDKVSKFNYSESRANHYYWHHEKGFDYCHYIDNVGYHWYGWYLGDRYFWTRNFDNRWWWYDGDFDRWCFWNDGFWWWQDPYHVGDLYCYNNTNYVPVNSAEDNVAVTMPEDGNTHSFKSPDNTRTVKLVADTQDAFLYDTANPPAFNPVYLASGVQDVQFSDTKNGRPLEIFLKLNDGSFDMFDSNGTPYSTPAPSPDATQGE